MGFFVGMLMSMMMSSGSPAAPSTTIDKKAVKDAEDKERRNKRNLRGRQLIGLADTKNGLGGIQNILGG
jgi:hypothetical protein